MTPQEFHGCLTFVPLAIGADLVGLEFQEALDGRLVLRRPLGGGVGCSSGHSVGKDPLWLGGA